MAARTPPQLLEREQETRLLLDAWREAASGRGALWFLCAEAGGGKSRLAGEVTYAAGSRALWGAAEPVTPPEPYLAIRHALPTFEPAANRGESAERLLELLHARGGPLLLVLDDLHFADEATIALAVRLGPACVEQPWLVLATYRPGEGSAALHAGVTELVAQGQAHRLELAPLSRVATGALAAEVRGAPLAEPELDALYADSGGNPWFAQALAEGSGAVSTARDRMLLRLDRVEAATPGANAVLAALAPATRPLPHAVVGMLCGGDGPELRRVLRGLRDAGVLREEEGAWGFRHELLRRSLLDAMLFADQQDVHRALAEALEQGSESRAGGGVRAAELAMHYAAAGDGRAAGWALRAAREAAAVDAHGESLAQLERALGFELEPETRRTALRAASLEAHRLGRFVESRRFAETAIAIPGGEPEVISLLHQRAADAARLTGDGAAAGAHMNAAEQALEGRPASFQAGYLAAGRVLQAAVSVEPERVEAAVARAMAIVDQLEEPGASRLRAEVRAFQLVSLLDQGDPQAFALLAQVEQYAASFPRQAPEMATTLLNAYTGAVGSLFHAEAAALWGRLTAAIERHELGWSPRADAYRGLELVQRGRFDEARALAADAAPAAGTAESVVLGCAEALREARAGSLDRARAMLMSVSPNDWFRTRALAGLVRLEVATLERDAGLAEQARLLYERTEPRRLARIAASAAVALARAGAAPLAVPAWLAPDAPLRVFWDWAGAISRRDEVLARGVAERLEAIGCPYEAALALADAGDLGAAYRALAALGAGAARQQIAEQLRAAGRPIPRRTRAALEDDRLTETERRVCALVAAGARNDEVATELGVSVRTVESHLARIYQKTDLRGRVALATWWRSRDQ